jgi:hypothetical protein
MATHIYQLTPSFNCAGQFAQSVFHYQFDDAGFTTTKAAASALITAFDTAKRTALRAFLPSDTTLISYRANQIQAAGGFNAYVPITSTNAGTRTGTQSASALNPVVVHFPLVPSQGRGKWYVPGISETDIEDGRYTDAYVSAINTLLTTFFGDLTLVGGGAPTAQFGWYSASANAFRLPQISVLSVNLGIQRRRMRPAG